MKLKSIPVILLGLLCLTACSNVVDAVGDQYPMEDIVYDDVGNKSEIFRAYDQKPEKVAAGITDSEEAVHKASKDGRDLMLYDDYLVQVYQDTQKEEDTIIEVSDKEFVRNNYDSDFFSDYGIEEEAEEVYAIDLDNRGGFFYTGYIGGSGGSYVKNAGSSPSVRQSSSTSSGVRGGGPGAGK
ncbi:DUF4247 domain-containing protein [Halobacillus sp. BAB-2008]|uniref:DUF4247 domain-containing protein n=1 Tax=Halobacillus sp. BAB-2008 TaxID=1246484 RepID=UPI0002A50904|nr:DUF4247 domain-containing protein [Halobacillus sp. BAB-2008]ELK48071.1 hypothetical protein D479_04128 [Halobacillus sp. BAB-2008]